MTDDAELLRRYAKSGSQPAFGELINRHLGLVYHAALRRTGDNATVAQDVAQSVFIEAARKAATLAKHGSIAGWLYTATRNIAVNQLRSEQRRRRIEEAAAMHELTTATPTVQWERIRPVIDDALDELEPSDREAILVRFFEGRSFADVGAIFLISPDAARMRIDRALDKLRVQLERRGVESISTALATVLATQGAMAVPAGTAAAVAAGVTAAGTAAIVTPALFGLMSTTKVLMGTAGVAALLLSTLVWREHERANNAETELAAVVAERARLQARLARSEERLQQAETRSAEAEKDTGKLLEAVNTARAKQPSGAKSGAAPLIPAANPVAAELLEQLKAKAKKWGPEEAKRRKELAEQTRQLDAISALNLKLAAVEARIANGDFMSAGTVLNQALEELPVGFSPTDQMKQLQATIDAQTTPVEFPLLSDGQTVVAVANSTWLQVFQPFEERSAKIRPGNYEVIGRRHGFQEVVIPVVLRNGVTPPVINVVCTVPAVP